MNNVIGTYFSFMDSVCNRQFFNIYICFVFNYFQFYLAFRTAADSV